MNACQSAPELRNIMTTDSCSGQQHDVHEIESGSESCTSTTNTTSEDYAHMKIYQPGPPGAIYDQGFSDSSEYVDMSSQQQVQQQQSSQVQHKQSICSSEVMSINESAEYRHTAGNYLAKSLDTQCLVDTIRAITPRPASPLPLVQGPPRQPKHVEFVGIKDEEVTDAVVEKNYQSTCEMSCQQESSTSCCMTQSEIPVMKQLPPTQIQNAVPHEWESAMVKALQTAPNTAYYGKEAQGSLMSSVLTTCPSASMDFTPKFPNYPVPLPEETPAYFPPPINMKVVANTDICGAKSPMLSALITAPDRPYSPFPGEVIYQLDDLPTPTCKMNMQTALQTASDRPYTPMQFDSNGLATATSTTESRCMESTFEERTQQQQQQQQCVSSAFASVTKATPQPRAFQPPCDTMAEDHHNFVCTSSVQASICQAYNQQRSVEQSQVIQSQALNSSVEVSRQQQSQQQQSVEESSVQGQWHQRGSIGHQQIFIPAHNNSHQQEPYHHPDAYSIANTSRFGHLHKPDTIPSYQQNFQNLASQQPHRPPVSPQLKDNVPLAFLESPLPPISMDLPDHFQTHSHHPSSHHPQRQSQAHVTRKPEVVSNPGAFSAHGQTTTAMTTESSTLVTGSKKEYGHQDYTNFTQISVPVLPKPNGPITMTFQSLDEVETLQQMKQKQELQMEAPRYQYQPEIPLEYQQQITQQQQKQVRDEMHQMYSAPRPYTPSMINKPAPIIPHYQKNLTVEECQAANSELFDPSRRSPSPCPMTRCAAQGPPPNPLKMMQATPQVIESSQFREFQQKDKQNWQGMQGASQTTFMQRPEEVQQSRFGNMNMQTKSNESQMNQNKRMEAQSQSVQQVGNAQVQRRTRVVEEFERSQTAKTVEIRTSSDGTVTSVVSSGGTGAITAPDTMLPKISEDEMPPRGIVASQARRFSQDVTATSSSVASKVQSLNASFFPTNPVPVEKTCFPVYNPDDTKRNSAVVFPPPGFGAHCGGGNVKQSGPVKEQRPQQQQKQPPNNIPINYSAKPFSYTASSDLNAITIPSITQFKPMMNSNKSRAAGNHTNQSNLPSSPLVFPPTMNNPLANQQQQAGNYGAPAPTLPPLTTTVPLSSSVATSNGTASSFGQQASFKSTSSSSSATAASVGASVLSSGANCPSSTNNSNTNNKNNNKGGAGITVGPKRGRGVMNKAVAPGGRVPLCGCCNSQIRLAQCSVA